jgi:NADH-quinone oxidoreductase subunit E
MNDLISTAAKQEIDQWLTKYPPDQKRSALLIALRLVQEEHGGWLTTQHMDAVAEYLDLPKIAVYEVATFYKMYNLKPVGKNRIAVCNNISCMLNGSANIIEHLEDKLGIKAGETTEDGCFTLKETECLAACVHAPVLQVNDKDYYENLTLDKIDTLIAKLKESHHE